MHTNEVHMKLSPAVSVQTSTKHAAQVLQRRKHWVQEQQDLVQEQLDAMRARKDFAAQEREDEGVCVWPLQYHVRCWQVWHSCEGLGETTIVNNMCSRVQIHRKASGILWRCMMRSYMGRWTRLLSEPRCTSSGSTSGPRETPKSRRHTTARCNKHAA